jgi:tricorn protease
VKTKKNIPLILSTLIILFFIPLIFCSVLNADEGQRALMRYPDIHKNTVLFVYGGDIWKVSAKGGIAVKLTVHDGQEVFPRFSPCGKLIAFTGQYDGNSDVYVMNNFGGNIRRVTYHPGRDTVIGWHKSKKKIIFASNRDASGRYSNLYLIKPDGTDLEKIPIHEIAQGSYSPDGERIVYNRVTRENRTWKRYKGGLAQEVYLYNFKTQKETKLTNFEGTDRIPMWIGNKIYFSSDRDNTLNLYSKDPDSQKQPLQLTRHKEYDVRFPSSDGESIVYECGGFLYLYNLKDDTDKQIPIKIQTDAPERRSYIKNVKNMITDFDISPNGKRALITARGEIFSVPLKNGPTRNISKDCGARDHEGIWSPNGNKIMFISDRNGEFEIYLTDSKGLTKAKKLTSHKDGYRQNIRFSPDGLKVAFADHSLTLYYLNLLTGNITKVDKAYFENVDVDLKDKPIYDFTWSPDSRFIAYSKMDKDLVNKIYIYSMEDQKIHCLSNGTFNDFHPVFTRDGKHLIFISNRSFTPTFCDMDWEFVYKNLANIYALTLRKNGKPLFEYRSDEAKESKKSPGKIGKVKVKIDFMGICQRIERFPVKSSNYRHLSINRDYLFMLNSDKGDYNRFKYRDLGPRDLLAFSFKNRKLEKVVRGVREYKLSASGSHLIFQQGRSIGIAKAVPKTKPKMLNLSGLKMKIDPVKEWTQLYNEAWRLERDFYYEPAMKGNDWLAIKKKYAKLLKYASCRQDTGYLIGEMIGELNTSHTYVFGGDRQRRSKRVNTGLLGVDWKLDKKHNLYQFKKILRVTDFATNNVPPLARPGLNISEGHYLLAVNGVKVSGKKNIYSYFEGLAGIQTTLLVNSNPTIEGARKVVVKPAYSERSARYLDWVEANRKKVQKASNGQIGYLHLPDTYLGSAVEFPKYFYSQLTKKGIIIDGRYNGGGLDPSIFLRRMARKIHSYWTRRYSADQISPPNAINAHLALITNKQAGSGGDELPYIFQHRKMGKVIGTRSWGGLVGVSMFISLMDGGGISAPDYRIYNPEGKWIIENYGVKPDIEVENTPAEMLRGYDAQLETTIKHLLEKIKKDPKKHKKHAPFIIEKR